MLNFLETLVGTQNTLGIRYLKPSNSLEISLIGLILTLDMHSLLLLLIAINILLEHWSWIEDKLTSLGSYFCCIMLKPFTWFLQRFHQNYNLNLASKLLMMNFYSSLEVWKPTHVRDKMDSTTFTPWKLPLVVPSSNQGSYALSPSNSADITSN